MSDIVKHGDQVDIVQFLPPHLVNSATGSFVKAIEDYVNQMYEYKKDDKSANRVNCTLSQNEYEHRLSLLGKIKDLSNLHDAKKVDHELIGKLANLLGYDFGVATTEIMNMVAVLSNGGGGDDYSVNPDIETKLVDLLSPYNCGDDPVDKATEFVRQMLVELPYWFSIKGTDKLAKIFFWCFGLMMKWEYGWTKQYSNSTDDWRYSERNDYINGYIPTSHARASFDLNESFKNENIVTWLNTQGLDRVVETLSSIKPINVVIDDVIFYLTMPHTLKVNLSLGIDSYYNFSSKDISNEFVWDGGFGKVDVRNYMLTRPVTSYTFRNGDFNSFLAGPLNTVVAGNDDGTGYNPVDVVFTFEIPDGKYASYEEPN